MKKLTFLKLIFLSLFLGLFTFSCRVTRDPLVVTTKPDQPVYLRKISPGDAYTWIEGEWTAKNGRYHWQKGRWVKPKNREWIPGSWQSRGNGWYWQSGHWEQINNLYRDISFNQETIFQ